MKRYREKHREAIAAYNRYYNSLNSRERSETHKRWKKANPEKLRKKVARWNKSEKGKIASVKQRAKHRVARCLQGTYYCYNGRLFSKPRLSKEQKQAARRSYNNKRKAENIQHSIAHRLRNRILTALRNRRLGKNASTTKLIGCSWAHFLAHIESLFTDKMGWHNRDRWELDHVQPLDFFDLGSEAGQKQAFHYSNTRPVWTLTNRKKGAKAEPTHQYVLPFDG